MSSVIIRLPLITLTATAVSACGADGEIFNRFDIGDNKSVSIDAQQRVINNIPLKPGSQEG